MFVRSLGSDWIAQAPAKLNLHFEIKARRDDGYHEIETVMVPIDVYDTLLFRPDTSGAIKLDCRWALGLSGRVDWLEPLPASEENLVFRGLNLFRERAGIPSGASVRLVKRIPSAAGLGGGSSDVAAALSIANEAWKVHWPREKIVELAAEMGSDVPFFLGRGPSVCRGRGEHVDPILAAGRLHFVVVKPPEGLATSDVYAASRPAKRAMTSDSMVSALRSGDAAGVGRLMKNRLQSAGKKLSPCVKRLSEEFRGLGLLGHQMTGSGTSYFGICRHRRHARQTAEQLRQRRLGGVFRASSCFAG